MIYVWSTLAGIGGSLLALVLFIVVIATMNVLNINKAGMVGISIVVPLSVALLGFVLAFYLVVRNSK